MKKYMVYMDDGRDCFKVAVPAKNEKAARDYVMGNGEIIDYKQPLTDKTANSYELVFGGKISE